MALYISAPYPSMIPLEKQVVSLELARRLKELEVKQESYFYWSVDKHSGNTWLTDKTYQAGSISYAYIG